MVDIVLHPEAVPVQPPDLTIDLLSLNELKLGMGVPVTDTSQDAQLSMWITRFSDVVATTCNRVFAYGQVIEQWQCLQSNRIFLTRYPVKAADVTSITVGPPGSENTLDPTTDWILEEPSGKIELLGSRSQPIIVTYSGGYNLPDEAPPALKQACDLLIQEWRAIVMRLALGGVSGIRHKESDVRYFDPLALLRGKGIGWAANDNAVHALLMKYTRLQV